MQNIEEEILKSLDKPHKASCNISPPPHICDCQLVGFKSFLLQSLEKVKLAERAKIREMVVEMKPNILGLDDIDKHTREQIIAIYNQARKDTLNLIDKV